MATAKPQTDTPDDYTHALPLQISGTQGVVSVQLPQSVYLNAQMGDLADLRVFDAKGVAQPFALYRPSMPDQIQRTTLPANIFPVHAQNPSASGNSPFDLAIQTHPDGSIASASVQVHSGKSAEDAPLKSLILDFGPWQAQENETTQSRKAYIEALRFDVPPNQVNYIAEIWLETSNDLKSWKTAGAAELSWLSNEDEQVLANDRLDFSPQRFRYARLNWRRGEPAQFARIQAELAVQQSSQPVLETLWLSPSSGKQAGDLIYKASPALPVEQVDLRLDEANTVYPMMLGVYTERLIQRKGNRRDMETIFQPLTRATFYRITQDGETRHSGSLSIGRTQRPEWVIRPLNPGSTLQPELGLSWQPATLIFLASGTPPYSLHFGRANTQAASQSLSQVAPGFSPNELNRLEKAKAGELQIRHAAFASSGEDDAAQNAQFRRTLALWGALLLGVAALGSIAWQLVRQMNSEPKPPQK